MNDTSTTCIFHICTAEQLANARRTGEHRTPSLETEGFIHFSQAHQVRAVVETFYAGQAGLLLMVVAPSLLTSPLRYEPPAHPAALRPPVEPPVAGGGLYPHLYGPLNAGAIIDTVEVSRFNGSPVLDFGRGVAGRHLRAGR